MKSNFGDVQGSKKEFNNPKNPVKNTPNNTKRTEVRKLSQVTLELKIR